jgi:hypothetical protein
MYSLRHVFWRAAMALSLLTVGIGSGFGFREAPVRTATASPACATQALRASEALLADRLDHARALAAQSRARVGRRG